MKIRVTIDAETYEVEVGDLKARPIQATIEGETFDVWPEETLETNRPAEDRLPMTESAPVRTAPASTQPAASSGIGGAQAAANAKAVTAPIPGVIITVSVKEGQAVTFGQDLCILEAMKMKNIIRANRAGTVAAIRVAPGDQVKRAQVLLEYTD